MNSTFMAAVRCYVDKCQDEWDEFVPLVASAIRSAVNRTTGFTPNRLMLGREVHTPAEIMVPSVSNQPASDIPYVNQLESNLKLAHSTARETLKVELKRAKRDYDVKTRVAKFKKGDVVYTLDHAPANKLQPKWIGPCVVSKVCSPFVYKLKYQRREWMVNHDSMKPCHEKNLPVWVTRFQEKLRQDEEDIYCVCKKPDDGFTMVECLSCFDWFHGHCMKLTQKQAQTMNFICPRCVTN